MGGVTLGGDRVVVLSGDIDAVGMVTISESTAAAARAIKQDIAQTLCSRVEMLFEDWALQEEEGVIADRKCSLHRPLIESVLYIDR
jgi:hypothetical protein